MAETVELAQVPERTDGDSSANESGFAGHLLSTDNAAILRELACVKAVFQLRAIVAAMGVGHG